MNRRKVRAFKKNSRNVVNSFRLSSSTFHIFKGYAIVTEVFKGKFIAVVYKLDEYYRVVFYSSILTAWNMFNTSAEALAEAKRRIKAL